MANQAPTSTIVEGSYATTEDGQLQLKGTGLSVGDADGGSGVETAILSVGEGALTVTAGDSGAQVLGSGSSSVTIEGTIGEIDALLGAGGTSTVSYSDASAVPEANVALKLSINDLGNGGGGELTALASSTIAVAAVDTAPTFSVGNGVVTTTIGSITSTAYAVIVQPDGKIIAAGAANSAQSDFALARYNPNGSLDTSFGSGGKVSTDIGSTEADGRSVMLQPDGKIIVAGLARIGSYYDFALTRYDANGTLDSSFGTGGIVTTSIGALSAVANAAFLQADGKIVVAGYSSTSSYQQVFALARYNASGSLDTSFGSGGKVTTAFEEDAEGYAVTEQPDGKILVSGTSEEDFVFALARYDADGSLDTSFGHGGTVTTFLGYPLTEGYAVTVQPDGKIVVAGVSSFASDEEGVLSNFVVLRYNTDGSVDTSFGGGTGEVRTQTGISNATGLSVTLQPDGKILVAGNGAADPYYGFALVRYNADGSLDSTFGNGGIAAMQVGQGRAGAYSVTLQPDGKIVVAGSGTVNGSQEFAVARYNANGTLDPTFDATNTLGGTATFYRGGAAVVLDSGAQVFDAELAAANNYGGATLTLVRNGGAVATDIFGASGTLSFASGIASVGGAHVGTVSNASGKLTITFAAGATQSQVTSVLDQLTYSDSSAALESPQISFTFSDGNSGPQGSGGPLTATGFVTVQEISPNVAPTGTSATLTANEDGALYFSAANFGFSDSDGNAFKAVEITTLPTSGTLTDAGAIVTAGQSISVSDLDNGRLVFTPAAEASGAPYASFKFQVEDNGGTANGGIDTDPTPKTMTIDVTPSDPAAVEQELLELINRARLDPAAEAARDGIDLNQGLAAGTISTASKQPLAMNPALVAIATAHSQDMINNNYFSDVDPATGFNSAQRMTAAGYPWTNYGEDIAYHVGSAAITQAIELGADPLLFASEGTDGSVPRLNMLNASFQEVGVGEVNGLSTQSLGAGNTAMLTEDFGVTDGGTNQFLTGVVFNDNVVADQFYTIGEGRGNVTVAITSGSLIATSSAGGYAEQIGAGVHTVTFSGGDEATPAVLTAVITAGTNAKIDLMGQSTIRTSVSVTAVSGISTIIGLGTIGLTLTGGSESDTISGGTGNDVINGGGGINTASYSNIASAAATWTETSPGTWQVRSADGTDTLSNIDALQFLDRKVTLGAPVITIAQYEGNEASYNSSPSGFAVVDTAVNIIAGLATLNSDVSNITSITVTGTPLVTGVAKFQSYEPVLDKIVGNFALTGLASSISGDLDAIQLDLSHITAITGTNGTVTASVATFAADKGALDKIGSFAIVDSAANILAGLATLSGDVNHIASITVTGTPLVTGVGNFSLYEPVLDKIPGGFNFGGQAPAVSNDLDAIQHDIGNINAIAPVGGVVTASVATFTADKGALDKIGSFAIVDNATNIFADINALEGDQGPITSITVTGAPLVTGAGKFTPDEAVLNKIVGGFGVSGLSSNINAIINALEGDVSNITGGMVFTDLNPVLNLTSTQATNDAGILAKITSAYVENVTGAGSPTPTTTTGHGNGLTITAVTGGHDTITGNGSSEGFVFKPAFGQDTITDVASHLTGTNDDTITLPSSEFTSFATMLSHAVQLNGNVIVTAAGTPTDQLTIDNVTIATLNAHTSDFKFA